MSQTVSWQKQGEIAVIEIDNPPVNALSQAVRQGLISCIDEAEADGQVKGVVIACKGRTFIAGADISELGKPPREPHLPDVLKRIDACGKPVVAALHGTALGGGLETALSCHYRIADSKARVGLPEVRLGLIPGAGGTQRLPRLAGVEAALDMITSGRQAAAGEALQLGIVDRICERDLMDNAIAYARELVAVDAGPRRTSELQLIPSDEHRQALRQYSETLSRRARGQLAPQRCVDAIEAAINLPFAEGIAKEREYFLECRQSPQSRAMRHIFFAERAATKIEGIPKEVSAREIGRVGIVGAGTMGGGIAMNFANAGIPVTLLETSREALDRGLGLIEKNYRAGVAKGKLTEEDCRERMSLFNGVLDYDALADADLVIEAVFENMAVKQEVFGKLDGICKPGAVLATNTSTLDVNEIAAATSRPEQVLGLHFFSPANVMRLLEIIRGGKTADDVLVTAMSLAKTIGKVGVVSGVCDGFIGNRMLHRYVGEASRLLLEGATPEQVDSVLREFGFAMGPFQVGDLAGLDIGYSIRQQRRERGDTVEPEIALVPDRLVEAGRKGQKTGCGYYRYREGDRIPIADPEVAALIDQASAELGFTRREISDGEILKRCIYSLVNEGAKILEEGIAQRAGDIDVVWVNGYGFPVYRGGPMCYATETGLENVLQDIRQFADQYGDRWQPAPLLEKCAQSNSW